MATLTALLVLAALAFWLGQRRALAVSAGRRLRARPVYYGHYAALWSVVPAAVAVALAASLDAAAPPLLAGIALAVGAAGAWYARSRISPESNARVPVERAMRFALAASSLVAILTTAGIIASLIFEALRFFDRVSLAEFLFGLHGVRKPPSAPIRSDRRALSAPCPSSRARC